MDFHASELNLAPVLDAAALTVEVAGNDSFAFLPYSSWFGSAASMLNRSIVLAANEGVLLVQDSFDVTDDDIDDGRGKVLQQAGPVWHFSPTDTPLTSPTGGGGEPAWVMSQGAGVNLFVAVDLASPGSPGHFDVGVQTVDVWSKNSQQSAFGKATLDTPGRYSFVSLLVPAVANHTARLSQEHRSDADGQRRNFVVSVAQHPSGSGVTASVSWPWETCSGASYCGRKVEMALGIQGDATWTVKRSRL